MEETARRAAFAAVVRDPRLRRIQLADVGSMLGTWGFAVALGVYAYDQGGPTLVGLTTLARLIPMALAAPLSGALANRLTRRGLMIRSDLTGAACLFAAAALLAVSAPAWLVLAFVAVRSVGAAWFRPTKTALVPALTSTPDELTAMNVVSGFIENAGMFGGPALGGLLLAVSSPQVVFAATGAALLWSAFQISRIDFAEEPAEVPLHPSAIVTETRDGLLAVRENPNIRGMVVLLTLQTFVAGALGVLTVLVALEQLRRGPDWVGYLEAAGGIGGVVGALAATTLVGRRRLSGSFGLAMVLWGAPIALLAAVTHPVFALAMLLLVGGANSLGDVAYITLLQRAVPEEQIARIFGGLEGIILGSMALGGIACSQLSEAAGLDATLLVFGGVLPVATALAWPALRRIDGAEPPPERVLSLLRGLPLFGSLPAPSLERLAFAAVPVAVGAGHSVFAQGDVGDRCYIMDSGSAEVVIDGKRIELLGPGDLFGEIALVRDIPRTATVRAVDPLELWALDRDEFLSAMGASPEVRAGAEQMVAARLSYSRPALASA